MFGSDNSFAHGGNRYEERVGDLLSRQPSDDAQEGKRNATLDRQHGMACPEHETQDAIGHLVWLDGWIALEIGLDLAGELRFSFLQPDIATDLIMA